MRVRARARSPARSGSLFSPLTAERESRPSGDRRTWGPYFPRYTFSLQYMGAGRGRSVVRRAARMGRRRPRSKPGGAGFMGVLAARAGPFDASWPQESHALHVAAAALSFGRGHRHARPLSALACHSDDARRPAGFAGRSPACQLPRRARTQATTFAFLSPRSPATGPILGCFSAMEVAFGCDARSVAAATRWRQLPATVLANRRAPLPGQRAVPSRSAAAGAQLPSQPARPRARQLASPPARRPRPSARLPLRPVWRRPRGSDALSRIPSVTPAHWEGASSMQE